MRRIFTFFFPLFIFAADIQTLITHYKNGHYKYVCLNGYKLFSQIKKDEDLVSMYAFSCLRADYINRLAVPILILGKTPQSRKNRSYFSLLLTQKNLLISALGDKVELTNISCPNTDHIISKVFNLYFQKKYKKTDNIYIMQDPKKEDHTYQVSIIKRASIPYLKIEEYQNGKKVKIHIYR